MSSSRMEEVKLPTKNLSLLCSNTLTNGAHLRQNTSTVRGHIRRLWPKTRITVGVAAQSGNLTGDLGDTIEFETPDCLDFETDTGLPYIFIYILFIYLFDCLCIHLFIAHIIYLKSV